MFNVGDRPRLPSMNQLTAGLAAAKLHQSSESELQIGYSTYRRTLGEHIKPVPAHVDQMWEILPSGQLKQLLPADFLFEYVKPVRIPDDESYEPFRLCQNLGMRWWTVLDGPPSDQSYALATEEIPVAAARAFADLFNKLGLRNSRDIAPKCITFKATNVLFGVKRTGAIIYPLDIKFNLNLRGEENDTLFNLAKQVGADLLPAYKTEIESTPAFLTILMQKFLREHMPLRQNEQPYNEFVRCSIGYVATRLGGDINGDLISEFTFISIKEMNQRLLHLASGLLENELRQKAISLLEESRAKLFNG